MQLQQLVLGGSLESNPIYFRWEFPGMRPCGKTSPASNSVSKAIQTQLHLRLLPDVKMLRLLCTGKQSIIANWTVMKSGCYKPWNFMSLGKKDLALQLLHVFTCFEMSITMENWHSRCFGKLLLKPYWSNMFSEFAPDCAYLSSIAPDIAAMVFASNRIQTLNILAILWFW